MKLQTLKEIESNVILDRWYSIYKNDVSGLAISLGVSKMTVYRKLKKLGVKIDE